jgi:hypothetical protein
MSTAREEHDSAALRLHAALTEQDRLKERYRAAIGTSAEVPADAQLRAAAADAKARDAWLKWVDDERYRGLNSGPFTVLREREELAGKTIGASASNQEGTGR